MNPWLQAFRLRTLPLAVSSIVVGSALGYFYDRFEPWVMVADSVGAVTTKAACVTKVH